MAAVKTQRGGPRKEPVFAATSCGACSGALNTLKESWRVKVITFVANKRNTRFAWYHRSCVK
jgi:hypothetical protein